MNRHVSWLLRVLVALGLGVDAYVHLKLAGGHQEANPAGIGQGNLFRIESAAAILAALWVLLRGSRPAYAVAALVGLSALVAVLLSRYLDVPSLGPIPSMYEPIWFGQKVVSAIAEGVAGVLAIVRVLALRPRLGRPQE